MKLTEQFQQALLYATTIHGDQLRKGTEIPYVSHLLGVASIVMEEGGSEAEVIAALLHDAGEDAGGAPRIADIRERFGETVGDIVLGCTDSLEGIKPPWRERKEQYIAHLEQAAPAIRLVSAADKLHNARSILMDLRQLGERLWPRFSGKKEGILWYYRELVKAFRRAGGNPRLAEELARTVSELEKLAMGEE